MEISTKAKDQAAGLGTELHLVQYLDLHNNYAGQGTAHGAKYLSLQSRRGGQVG